MECCSKGIPRRFSLRLVVRGLRRGVNPKVMLGPRACANLDLNEAGEVLVNCVNKGEDLGGENDAESSAWVVGGSIIEDLKALGVELIV